MRFIPTWIVKGIRLSHCSRHLSTSPKINVDKQALSRLRKLTGFPFIKCREALNKFNNNVKEAEKWMQDEALKQGWSTAGKLANRPMSQGLIGVLSSKNCAVLVEVNCETDFVARNNSFQNLVSSVAEACLKNGLHRTAEDERSVIHWTREEIESLPSPTTETSDKSIADLVAVKIGSVGENMRVRRAGMLKANENSVFKVTHYCHTPMTVPSASSVPQCQFGTYGAVLLLETKSSKAHDISGCGRNLCQHIVGMNPVRIGSLTDDNPVKEKDEEALLIYQPYLLNENITVQEYVEGQYLWPVEFIRYQCGEKLPQDDE